MPSGDRSPPLSDALQLSVRIEKCVTFICVIESVSNDCDGVWGV